MTHPLASSLAATVLAAASLGWAGTAHAQEGAAALPSPLLAAESAARALANVEIAEAALERDRGDSDYEQAIAITVYVGGVALSIASVSLLIGIAMEAACVNGDVSECTDGPAFLSAAIPTAIGAAALLYGATLTQGSVDRRRRTLDERERELDERRHTLERQVGLALGPASFQLRVSF